ncbi:uncharacterized protein SOCEGT47_001400 [Sorangium cellulosum]|uniref:Uncharacterized protein n=1 Tax=Sorangium cellulosum TaxID=56 RepID=A0A4P2PT25_SORCE|nr:hypothetical protein [Sorangium cellulosum]AUX19688.1 uncharacterized protein SOCEGT47_001400 [Sorangium cellulosum]
MAQTPVTALVRHIKVERASTADGDLLTYHAEVLRTLRGSPRSRLSYIAAVERGESSSLPGGPVLVTLCESGSTLYWPGTGSLFDASPTLLEAAEQRAASLDARQTHFELCEE